MPNIAQNLKNHKTKVIRAFVITGIVVATVVVAGALYKANVDAKTAVELAEAALTD